MGPGTKPQAILSSRDDGYDVQFEEMRGVVFVCRKCSFHAAGGDGRMQGVSMAIQHLACHKEDRHRIDPRAMQMLLERQ